MRITIACFGIALAAAFSISSVGCSGSNEPYMEDRTEEEIQAMEAEIYGAEEEEEADMEAEEDDQ